MLASHKSYNIPWKVSTQAYSVVTRTFFCRSLRGTYVFPKQWTHPI